MPDQTGKPAQKKTKAYPIPVTIKLGTGSWTGQIVKITLQGFLAEITANQIQPGDKFEVSFELPVVRHVITEGCVLVKLYNQWGGAKPDQAQAAPGAAPSGSAAPAGAGAPSEPSVPGKVIRLAEIHFQSLSLLNRGRISSFYNLVHKNES